MTSDSVPRRVFTVWYDGPMPAIRAESLAMLRRNVGVDVVLIDKDSLPAWLVPAAGLHPAFKHLSDVHKADYLRCYLMHFQGGGYVDLKPVDTNWSTEFDRLDAARDFFALGYREPNRGGIATFGLELKHETGFLARLAAWSRYRWLQANYRSLMGNDAFIFRPQSPLTTEWFAELSRRLDGYADQLSAHPAAHPRDHLGFLVEGRKSGYPIPWSAILGDILHPLSLKYRRRILRTLTPPRFTDYR